MSTKKDLVEVFGITGEVANDPGCDCGEDSCGDPPTMDEQTEGLQRHFELNGYNSIKVNFIDIENDEHEKIATINSLLEDKYPLPFIAINGQLRFYSAIVPDKILEEIKTQKQS